MNQKVVTARWVGPELEYEGTDAKGNIIKMGGTDFSPAEMLLLGFAGCMGMDVKSILDKKQLAVDSVEATVTGYQPEDYPKPYKKIAINFVVKGKAIPAQAVERAITLSSDKYCVVGQTLKEPVELATSFEITE
jgi:putative redox protein